MSVCLYELSLNKGVTSWSLNDTQNYRGCPWDLEFVPGGVQTPDILNPKLQQSKGLNDGNSGSVLVKKAYTGNTNFNKALTMLKTEARYLLMTVLLCAPESSPSF